MRSESNDVQVYGLFGCVEGEGTIQNVNLTGVLITGNGQSVGGLTGRNNGMIKNCMSTSSVTGGSPAVGRLVGYNAFGTVENRASAGSVTGGGYVGGLVGVSVSGGAITHNNVYNSVKVKGIPGGSPIIGFNNGNSSDNNIVEPPTVSVSPKELDFSTKTVGYVQPDPRDNYNHQHQLHSDGGALRRDADG